MGYFFVFHDAFLHFAGFFCVVPRLHSPLCALVTIQKSFSNLNQIIGNYYFAITYHKNNGYFSIKSFAKHFSCFFSENMRWILFFFIIFACYLMPTPNLMF